MNIINKYFILALLSISIMSSHHSKAAPIHPALTAAAGFAVMGAAKVGCKAWDKFVDWLKQARDVILHPVPAVIASNVATWNIAKGVYAKDLMYKNINSMNDSIADRIAIPAVSVVESEIPALGSVSSKLNMNTGSYGGFLGGLAAGYLVFFKCCK